MPASWARSARCLVCCLTIACASKRQYPPAAAPPVAKLADAGSSPVESAAVDDACAVVATVLAEPRAEFGGLSAIERPEAARAKRADGRWLVAISEPELAGSITHAIDCGERLALTRTKGPWPEGIEPFMLRLTAEGSNAYRFVLVLGQQRAAPASSKGRLERSETNEWRIAGVSSKAPRPLDERPVERALAASLPAGQAQAWFEFDTGKDGMGARGREAGLVLMVRWGALELRQVFASCNEGGKGNALGDLHAGMLDLAGCGEFYRLMLRKTLDGRGRAVRRLVVEKETSEGRWQSVISLPLPPEVRTVSNPKRERSGSNGG